MSSSERSLEMSNIESGHPWEIPPFPKRGDGSDRTTYAAVGHAISQWEVIEVEFAHLYSVLVAHSRFDVAANRAYGEPPNFKDRLAKLERMGKRYFTRYPSQENEGEFCQLTSRALHFSARRNDIAHSVARPIHWIRKPPRTIIDGPKKMRWCLVPPHFKRTKFTNGHMPLYVYTSKEILFFAGHFRALALSVNRLTYKLEEPHRASRGILPSPVTALSMALAERTPSEETHQPAPSQA